MTFKEWWKSRGYDPDSEDKYEASLIWEAATTEECHRCVKVCEELAEHGTKNKIAKQTAIGCAEAIMKGE